MNLTRPTRTTLILSLCMVLLAGGLGYEHFQLSKLTSRLSNTANKGSLDALLTRLSKVDERLDTVDSKHLVSNDDFRLSQQTLSNRIDAVQANAKQATESTEVLSRTVTSAEQQVMQLKASIDLIDSKLKKLSQSHASLPSTAPSTKPALRKKPPSPQPPPFTIIGIEYRGGERFLSVAPLGSTQLSQINLLSPGDGVAGTAWRLRSLDERLAHFDVAGAPKTLTISR